MILAILTTGLIVWSLGFSMRSGTRLIGVHRFNNRYSDAARAREGNDVD